MFSIKHFILLSIFNGLRGSLKFRSDYTHYPAAEAWLKFHAVPGTWQEARLRCYMEGAVLASPLNADIKHALRFEINNTTECAGIYVGVHSIFSKGYFYSLEGVPLSKMPVQWLSGEPDNADNNEDCIAYVDGEVADYNCSKVLPFVCYKNSTQKKSIMPCGTTDKEYVYSFITTSCYKLHKRSLIWNEAFKVCSAEGGYLAIINGREEADVLKDIYNIHYPKSVQHTVTHIGFHNWKDGVWRTVHGQTLEEAGYADWEKGQPDNAAPGEYCGGIFPNAKLDDFWCDRQARFFCEKDPGFY